MIIKIQRRWRAYIERLNFLRIYGDETSKKLQYSYKKRVLVDSITGEMIEQNQNEENFIEMGVAKGAFIEEISRADMMKRLVSKMVAETKAPEPAQVKDNEEVDEGEEAPDAAEPVRDDNEPRPLNKDKFNKLNDLLLKACKANNDEND